MKKTLLKHFKQTISALTAAFFMTGLILSGIPAVTASADSPTIDIGWGTAGTDDITSSGAINLTSRTQDAGGRILNIHGSNTAVTIVGDPNVIFTNLSIKISEGATVTLDNVRIRDSSDSPIAVVDNNNNTLNFINTNALSVINADYAAIAVPTGKKLTINGTNSNQTLTATTNGAGAGIGGGKNQYAGDITISNGAINASSTGTGSGIGSGSGSITPGSDIISNITINGGTITAIGGTKGAGIGNVLQSSSDIKTYITITGGKINSSISDTSTHGIGIGVGGTHNIATINISGNCEITASGKSTATPNDYHSSPGDGFSYPGIGEAGDYNSATVTINGGIVNATGGDSAPGIGGLSGSNGNSSVNVTINGGSVTATGGDLGAGIGEGNPTTLGLGLSPLKIDITGGQVNATGGNCGTGIGNQSLGGEPQIAISGGFVIATGGASPSVGIGSRTNFSGTSVSISGGTVIARGTDGDIRTESKTYISGGSVNAPNISPKPVNDANTPVYLTTITLPAYPSTLINSIALATGGTSFLSYGTNSIQTDNTNKLYLYLPESSNTAANVKVSDSVSFIGFHGAVTTTGEVALKMDQSPLIINSLNTVYPVGITPSPSITGGSSLATPTISYTGTGSTSYSSASAPTAIGTYQLTASKGADNSYYAATTTATFEITNDISKLGITIDPIAPQTNTGKQLKPVPTVKCGLSTLVEGTDYTVSYGTNIATGNGAGSVTISGKGSYSGVLTTHFDIVSASVPSNNTPANNSGRDHDSPSRPANSAGTATAAQTPAATVSNPTGTQPSVEAPSSAASAGAAAPASTSESAGAPQLDPATRTATVQLSSSDFSSMVQQAAETKQIQIRIPEVKGASSYMAALPAKELMQLDPSYKVTLSTEIGSVTLPIKNLLPAGIKETDSVSVGLISSGSSALSPALRKQLGARPVVELRILVNNKAIALSGPRISAQLSLAYTPTLAEFKSLTGIKMLSISPKGVASVIPGSSFNPATGMITFTAPGSGRFAVTFVQPAAPKKTTPAKKINSTKKTKR